MKKEESFVLLVLLLLFIAGCDKFNISGKAVVDINSSTTTTRDEITARYNRIINGIDTEEPQEVVRVNVVDTETNKTVTESTKETTTTTTTSTTTTTTTLPKAPSNSTTTTTIVDIKDGVEVVLKNSQISPIEVYIKAGQKVIWLNKEKDRVHMVVTTYTKEFKSDRIMPGKSFEHAFANPGEYEYIDAMDPQKIRGKVIVT